MHILVVYATKSGSTTTLAQWVADEVRRAGHEVTLVAAQEAPDPSEYTAVFVGSGIRAGNWHSAGVRWVTEYASALRELPVMTFTGSLRAADPSPVVAAEVTAYTTKVVQPLGITPTAHANFVGSYDPQKVALPERLLMKAMKQSRAVDDRDPDAVRAWTRSALETVH